MTEQVKSVSDVDHRPAWQRTGFILSAGVAYGAILIVSDQFGYEADVEWALVFILSLLIVGALNWAKRTRPWYWASIALAVAIHCFLLFHWQWQVIPAPGAVNMKGAVAIDAGLEWFWFFWMGWLFDPREKPRTSANTIAEIVLYGFAAVLIGIVALIWWGVDKTNREVIAESKVISISHNSRTMWDLKHCFFDGPHADTAWETLPGPFPSQKLMDGIYHTGVIITDLGPQRQIQITTLDGKALGKTQHDQFAPCLV